MALNYIIELSLNPNINLPGNLWVLATWRAASLHGFTSLNFQSKVNESLACTIKEQIGRRVEDLFSQRPNRPSTQRRYEILDTIAPDGNTLEHLHDLSNLFLSLEQNGPVSPVFPQALTLFGG